MHEHEAGREWRCPWPVSAKIDGNNVVIDFDSMLPLVLDPSFCKVRSDAGFQLWDGKTSTSAVNVSLTGPRQVTVTLPMSPATGNFIRYAYRQHDDQDVADEWPIATGALRDEWAEPSLYDPEKTLVRAALAFEWQL